MDENQTHSDIRFQIDYEQVELDVDIIAVNENGEALTVQNPVYKIGFLVDPENPKNKRLCVFGSDWVPLQHRDFLINGFTFLNPRPEEVFNKKDFKSPD
jgi:hypothetical protein